MSQIGGANKVDILKSDTTHDNTTNNAGVAADVTTTTNSNAEQRSELLLHRCTLFRSVKRESLEQKMWALKNKVSSFGSWFVYSLNILSLSILETLFREMQLLFSKK